MLTVLYMMSGDSVMNDGGLKKIEVLKMIAANMVSVAMKNALKMMWIVERAMLQRVVMMVQEVVLVRIVV